MKIIYALLAVSLLLFMHGCKDAVKETPPVVRTDTPVHTIDSVDEIAAGAVKADEYFDRAGIDTAGLNISEFVLPGYRVIDTCTGKLNLDEYPDMILILGKEGEYTSAHANEEQVKRPLLVLTGEPDGTYQLAARNDNTVYCINCGGAMGDPYMNTVIKNGYFSLEHYGGSSLRWSRTVTYKYSPEDNNWLLHKDGHESFEASNPEKLNTEIRTTKHFGRVVFEDFNIYAGK